MDTVCESEVEADRDNETDSVRVSVAEGVFDTLTEADFVSDEDLVAD